MARRRIARIALGVLLVAAGVAHLSFARISFRAQVPGWVPFDVDTIVRVSGLVEIALGLAFVCVRSTVLGWLVGGFFVAVLPGNIAQLVNHRDAFGLDSASRRALRLLLQPVLVAWALWSSGPHRSADA